MADGKQGAQEAWRAYLELALGVTEASRKKAQKVAKRLAGRGGATAQQLQSLADNLVSTSMANREALTKLVRFEVDRALGAVGLATAEEVADLQARIRDLERQLREVQVAGGAAAGGVVAAAAAPAKKAVAKRAVAKRAVATAGPATAVGKKAVAKKAVAKKAGTGPSLATGAATPGTAPSTLTGPAAEEGATGPAAPAKKGVAQKAVAKKAPAKSAVAKKVAPPAGMAPE